MPRLKNKELFLSGIQIKVKGSVSEKEK